METKIVLAKSKNRRVEIQAGFSKDKPSELCYGITVKRLVGKWQDRNIVEYKMMCTWQTMEIVIEALNIIGNDNDIFNYINNNYEDNFGSVTIKTNFKIEKPFATC